MLKKPETSVPSSGRPSCDTTVTISLCERKMERILPTYFDDCSSEIDCGSVARIQKLPSSSLGMNSPPKNGKMQMTTSTGNSASAAAAFGERPAKLNSG